MSRRRAQSGFTLIELMVALTMGALMITSLYAIASATTGQFHTQQQLASAQTALRAALIQVKRDIARAGYLGTPNVNVTNGKPAQVCNMNQLPAGVNDTAGRAPLAAFSAFRDEIDTPLGHPIDPTGNNRGLGFTADDIVLFANYDTADEYPGVTVLTNTNTISLSQGWHSFRRDFTTWSAATPAFSLPAFQRAFPIGRLIRIQTTGRARHFALVNAASTAPSGGLDPTITFLPALPSPCDTTADQGRVAPINALRYRVRTAVANAGEDARTQEATGVVGQLVREEVSPVDKTTLFTSPTYTAVPRVILDYVVAFNLSFARTTETDNGIADTVAPGVYLPPAAETAPGQNIGFQNALNDNPQLIRAVRIEIATRTPEQDPRLVWAAGPPHSCASMGCFQVFSNRPGAARVRRLTAEVLVPNVAFEGY